MIQLVLVMDLSKNDVVQITISHDNHFEESCMLRVTQLNLIVLKTID